MERNREIGKNSKGEKIVRERMRKEESICFPFRSKR